MEGESKLDGSGSLTDMFPRLQDDSGSLSCMFSQIKDGSVSLSYMFSQIKVGDIYKWLKCQKVKNKRGTPPRVVYYVKIDQKLLITYGLSPK